MYSLSFGGISIRRNGAPTMPTPQWPYRAYPFLILNYALLNSSQARPNFHAGPRLTRVLVNFCGEMVGNGWPSYWQLKLSNRLVTLVINPRLRCVSAGCEEYAG